MTHLDLALKIRLSIHNAPELDPAMVFVEFNRQLDDWSEGRYPFEVEMLKDAATRLFKSAVEAAAGIPSNVIGVYPDSIKAGVSAPRPVVFHQLTKNEQGMKVVQAVEVFTDTDPMVGPLFRAEGSFGAIWDAEGWCAENGYIVTRQEFKDV